MGIESGWKRDFINRRKEESESSRSGDESVERNCDLENSIGIGMVYGCV